MARLAVNVDHVATVREARGINEPDPVLAAGLAEMAGADGIICHLREDRRHIHDRDLHLLRQTVKTKLNMEMAAVDEMVEIALATGPTWLVLFLKNGGIDHGGRIRRERKAGTLPESCPAAQRGRHSGQFFRGS